MTHKNNGYKCEQYLARKFRDLGASVNIRNTYYDLEVKFPDKRIRKIEVKSAKFQTTCGRVRKFARFDFKYKRNLQKIKKHNVWLCFIVYVRSSSEIIGFVNPKQIDDDKRFYSLVDVINLKTTPFNSFIKKLNLKNG